MRAISEAEVYLWKCWRDSRLLFLTVLGAVLATGALFAYVAFDPFGWIAAKTVDQRALWQFTAEAFYGTALGVVPAAGLLLGALGVGTEFERRTADFLLTHPRPRRWFLWTSWGLGAAQMALLVVVCSLVRFAAPASSRFRAGTLENLLVSMVALWTLAMVYFSLTYLATTLTRNSRNGTGLALGVFTAYAIAFLTLRNFYDIHIPFIEELFRLTFRSTAGSSFNVVAGWLAVSLAMTVAAQFVFDRAEV